MEDFSFSVYYIKPVSKVLIRKLLNTVKLTFSAFLSIFPRASFLQSVKARQQTLSAALPGDFHAQVQHVSHLHIRGPIGLAAPGVSALLKCLNLSTITALAMKMPGVTTFSGASPPQLHEPVCLHDVEISCHGDGGSYVQRPCR